MSILHSLLYVNIYIKSLRVYEAIYFEKMGEGINARIKKRFKSDTGEDY